MIAGAVAPGYEAVRSAFECCFAELGETGAGFAAVADGRLVADLWGGDGFRPDGLVHTYSVTKPMAAFCVLVLADRGALGLDDPVARHWPEFAAAGKDRVTVRQLLAHQAGLVALREPLPASVLLDFDRVCALLAAEAPWWEPGTAHGEHALFYGHLCGALVRRIDGRSLGTFWREEVAGPWTLDFHIGLDEAQQRRAVDLDGEVRLHGDSDLFRLAVENPPGLTDLAVVNGPAWRAAEIPAVNGHGTARGVARFHAGLLAGGELDGVRLVSAGTVRSMVAGERTGPDLLLGDTTTWGLGVAVDTDGFGMGGLGGSMAWTDPALEVAEAYVTRHMADHARAELVHEALTRARRADRSARAAPG